MRSRSNSHPLYSGVFVQRRGFGLIAIQGQPTYVPHAQAFEVWPKQLSGASLPALRLKPLLEEIWKPYLDGLGTPDEGLAAFVTRAVAVSRP